MVQPDLEATWFFVPGTIGALMLTLVMTMTAFAIVREREIGTLEQIMVTPISPAELIVGKTVPYFTIALVQMTLVGLIAVFWFQVPFKGSILVMILGSVLFIFSVLAIGLVDFDRLGNPATGDGDLVLFHHAGDHALGLRFSDQLDANLPAVGDIHRSAALLRGGFARQLPQGKWDRSSVATNGGDGDSRGRPYHLRLDSLPQDARLAWRALCLSNRADFVCDGGPDSTRQVVELQHRAEERVILDGV